MAEAGQGLRVFISYARRDCAAFAEELLQGLELAGFDPFLDRHDIAAGEDWESRLSNLIHSADTVVFVISPSAVTSDRCAWEVERAQAISKRIIPIVAIDVPEAETPEGLRRRNYIFFSEGHSFVGALAQLSKALRTDVEWIREHTRLGELAERWRAKQKAEPMLLRGSELEGAKAWLTAWKAPAPEPTNAHREFIGESEAVELNRFSDERKRLEEVAALQAEKELVLARSRRRLKLGVAAVLVLLVVALASMATALVLYFENKVTKTQLAQTKLELALTNQRLIFDRASALVRERAARQAAGEPVAEAPDPVLERLGRLRAELVEAPAASAAPPATRAESAGDRLSPSFRLSEFTYSPTAERLGLSNTPTPEALENLRNAARQLERVRTLLRNAPIMINAAYSTPELGAALGRPPNSDHLQGHSVDFTAPAFGDAYAVAQAIAASPEIMAEVDQLIYEKGHWVHISFGPARRGQVLTAFERAETGRQTHYVHGIQRLDANRHLIEPPPQQQQQAAP